MSNNNDILYKELTDQIIGLAFNVHAKIGCALPEHIYERSLCLELTKHNIPHVHQKRYDVYYDDEHVGHFFTDIVVDNKVILELKSDEKITPNHFAQTFTYLRVTKLKVAYIINFGVRQLQFKRLIL